MTWIGIFGAVGALVQQAAGKDSGTAPGSLHGAIYAVALGPLPRCCHRMATGNSMRAIITAAVSVSGYSAPMLNALLRLSPSGSWPDPV
ncbi:hypothetical protein [Hungatella sp.]|uniref:hypothetical protein n=1 Tax=Hungatella sp. TaxID=2613924 RepID=UPI0039923F4F